MTLTASLSGLYVKVLSVPFALQYILHILQTIFNAVLLVLTIPIATFLIVL